MYDVLVAPHNGAGVVQVWRGLYMDDKSVAIKKMFPQTMLDIEEQATQAFDDAEVKVMMALSRHKRLLWFYGAGWVPGRRSGGGPCEGGPYHTCTAWPRLSLFFRCAGELPDGTLFMVSEFMAGGALSDALWGTAPLPWDIRLQYMRDVAAGMEYLHGSYVLVCVAPHSMMCCSCSCPYAHVAHRFARVRMCLYPIGPCR